jgi:hypothetical protein
MFDWKWDYPFEPKDGFCECKGKSATYLDTEDIMEDKRKLEGL